MLTAIHTATGGAPAPEGVAFDYPPVLCITRITTAIYKYVGGISTPIISSFSANSLPADITRHSQYERKRGDVLRRDAEFHLGQSRYILLSRYAAADSAPTATTVKAQGNGACKGYGSAAAPLTPLA
jgi:hypothetical protein